MIDSGFEVLTHLHVAATIETFQAQLEERLLTASNTLVTQIRDQARAITEDANANILATRLLLVKTLLKEIYSSLDNPRASPPSADGPNAPWPSWGDHIFSWRASESLFSQ